MPTTSKNFFNKEIIFCGSYDGYLYAFDIDENTKKICQNNLIKFDISCSEKKFGLIRSSPLISLINLKFENFLIVIVGTLNGFVIAFDFVIILYYKQKKNF